MNIFIDHNLPSIYAKVIHAYIEHEDKNDAAIALKDKFPIDISDIDWMNTLAAEKGKNWCFFTADMRLRRTKEEKEVFLRSGLVGIFIKKSLTNQYMSLQLSKIFKLLPEIKKEAEKKHKHSNFEISAKGNRLMKIQ